MKNTKYLYGLYVLGVVIGGGFVGCFANKLNTILGCIMFTIGIWLLSFSIYKYTKNR